MSAQIGDDPLARDRSRIGDSQLIKGIDSRRLQSLEVQARSVVWERF
jgi:hypothetical protein